MAEQRQFCTFHLADMFFGVSVDQIQEVLRYQRMTAVPLAAPTIEGLINLRGQIVTAIDLRRRLGMPDRSPDTLPMNVVVRSGDEVLSLLVDEIGDVLEVDEDRFEAPPETVEGVARQLITGVYKLDGRLLLVLDVDRTVDIDASLKTSATDC